MADPVAALYLSDYERRALGAAFVEGRPCAVEQPPPGALAFLAWQAWEAFGVPAVWVVDGPRTLDAFHQDLLALAGERADRVAVFPARETTARTGHAENPDLAGDRLDTLRRCRGGEPPGLLATCVQALLQPTWHPDRLARFHRALRVGDEQEPGAFAALLEQAGYRFEPQVQAKGVASLRGGILDAWPPHADWPVRVEFFGSTVESVRTFDPYAQRSRGRTERAEFTPAHEPGDAGEAATEGVAYLDEYVPPIAAWAWVDPEQLREHAAIHARAQAERDAPEGPGFDALLKRVRGRHGGRRLTLRPAGDAAPVELVPALRAVEGLPSLEETVASVTAPDVIERLRAQFVKSLLARAAAGRPVVVYFATEGARDRFVETFGRDGALPGGVSVRLGRLSQGFVAAAEALTVVAESDLYGQRRRLRGRYDRHGPGRGPRRGAGERVADWTDMQPGETVVHVEHGIGRYLGIYEIEFDSERQEVLAVEYAEKAKLYIPVAQAHLLSRYVGIGRRRPEPHKLGGARWQKEKRAAERAVRDLAAALLETQAMRQAMRGHAFPPDAPWQHEFEAAFPYEETPDQLEAIVEVKADLESERPMDRLICGDVGYGKTEVAMRAAFKVVMDGRQAAMLVPTTVLAQQHYDTFRERMAAFPVTIEMLSRFRTRGEQDAVVARLKEGAVDIVIGTHRLVQPDVGFKNLGLVIVDEEQRFGVAHKEALKQIRRMVDVLTLTATPIPRTLYMSLTGARDMSVIQTPPRERLPIETIVAPWSEHTVREAILREMNREGQVFYLHNRVQSIWAIRERLARLVPEARIEVAHGQMRERELAKIMHRFVRGAFDVLLCTTIIESGVDIPNVNTILIDRADRFGVADLYQLRGRVGRFKHQAYAYLLLPRHGQLFDSARRRIGAIRQYTSLGAGFKLALRDLELRGAGNMLGSAQSGHISAVGFDLYCQLLRRTVARLQGEAVPPLIDVRVSLDFIERAPSPETADRGAFLPLDYVEDENLRLGFYRRIAATVTGREVRVLAAELRDRFGPVPPPADRLLKIARIRILAYRRGLQSVEVRGEKVFLMRDGQPETTGGRLPRLAASAATARLRELIKLLTESRA